VLLIRELYGGARAVAVMALYGMAVGVAPAVGPLIGGYLQIWFGWQAGFWLVAGLALIAVVAVIQVVPEPPFEPHPIRPARVLATYGRLLMRRGYLAYLMPLSLIFGALFAFVTTGPLVFIDLLGVPTERYGLAYLVIVVSYVAGSMATSRMVKRVAPVSMVRGAALAGFAAAAILVAIAITGQATVFSILAAMALYGLALGVVMAAAPILLLDAVADLPQGSASALLGSCQLGAGALAGLISGGLYDGTPNSMLGTIAGFVALGALPVLFIRRSAAG